MKYKIQTIYYYTPDSEDDSDPTGGEYSSVGVTINNQLVRLFGDDYHDKGAERAEEFINTIKDLFSITRSKDKSIILPLHEYSPDTKIVKLKKALNIN